LRNVYDQYVQPENRLTHALLVSLDADSRLLRDFLRSFVKINVPGDRLTVVEQSLPGEPDILTRDEEQQRGLPDGWIYTEAGWTLLIESKFAAKPDARQVSGHIRIAKSRGATEIRLLWLTVTPIHGRLATGIVNRQWSDLYIWLSGRAAQSDWAKRAAEYFEIAEARADMNEYMKVGTLTQFAGIPFDAEHPYAYVQAKRVLGLLRDRLANRRDLARILGADPSHTGRGAITGRASTHVWDFVALQDLKGSKSFTQHPHLTLGITNARLEAYVTIPDKIRSRLRTQLLGSEYEHFADLMQQTTGRLVKALRKVKGSRPEIGVIQRRYPSQRAAPIVDADIRLDPRTAFPPRRGMAGSQVKYQPQWLKAAYSALAARRSNLQLQVGAVFPYDRCEAVHHPQIEAAVANVWIACKPLIAAARDKKKGA
jgi:hypothetical protein